MKLHEPRPGPVYSRRVTDGPARTTLRTASKGDREPSFAEGLGTGANPEAAIRKAAGEARERLVGSADLVFMFF